jgi:glutamate synthase domain-containing protein 2/glutamate synthase domain-containing protein 1
MASRVQPPSEHDACGVGFIAHLRGRAGHDIVGLGLAALRRLTHRGATAALGAVDGCGVLTAIPWAWLGETLGSRMPTARTRALGMLFVHPADRTQAAAIVDRELRAAGARAIEWRVVPTDRAAVLPAQRLSTPAVLQVVAGFDEARPTVETALYRARLRIERLVRLAGVRLTITSLSTRTVVYKALVTPDALDRFYPDLAETQFVSPFITFHQRFSTNTSADWALTQPFRTLAHNGEINTIAGNRLWMRARAADATALSGFAVDAPISTDGSDSRSLDDAIELLRHQGYSLAHAVTRLVPPAWERDRDLPPDVRAFYEFQSLLSEPWDGPSALVFADGRYVGAALDRNGFRPARVVSTAGDLIAVASEVGILPADEHEIVNRDRLGPGDMILVDVERGTVLGTSEIRRRLAFRHRYRCLVADVVRPLAADLSEATLTDAANSDCHAAAAATGVTADAPAARAALARRQAAFGCTREELDLILKPMIAGGHEAIGSMGDDAPPAVLSARARLFTDFFRQRFAQVTNPSVDPYREASVMSLTTMVGGHGSFLDELAPRPPRIVLRSPILGRRELAQLRASAALAPVTIELVFPAAAGPQGLDERLTGIAADACAAVRGGCALLVLSDAAVDGDHAMVPALLATATVHHALVANGLRMRASIVVDTGDARDAHQLGVLFGYGASAVCPSLGYDSVAALADADPTGCNVAATRYRLALERGLQTLMSKMGVCTFSGYCGAQLFEVLGLDSSVVDRFFPGTASPVGGIGLADVAATVLDRHRRAFGEAAPVSEYPGLHSYRRDGEYHATNPVIVRGLQKARDQGVPAYETFKSHVYNRPPSAIRDLLEFAPPTTGPVPLDAVESAADICRRFFASAMSVGALSPEAHRMIAVAMNRLGARSNSGEGGEEPDRFTRRRSGATAARTPFDAGAGAAAPAGDDGADWDGSRTKQIASARFGVTPAYLRSADELQIKIAQGSKPGEGGQLPGMKVMPHIARLRHAQPGTTLISPPVHHDIYSIEDLAELIHDLRVFHPTARINVKLVASVGVGIIAAGVAKAGADAIQISGHDGGTGASPRASIKHAGMPWEIGLSEAHQALSRAGLRGRVVLQTDGGLKTGRDIAIAAALGADEYGFGTAALVALGCVMARQCHANTCPVGIATQRDDLRAAFVGTADMLIGYLTLIAGEVREILAGCDDAARPEHHPAGSRVRRASRVGSAPRRGGAGRDCHRLGAARNDHAAASAGDQRPDCQYRPRLRRADRRRHRGALRRRRAAGRIGPPRDDRQRRTERRRVHGPRHAAGAGRRRQRRARQGDARRRNHRRAGGARTRPRQSGAGRERGAVWRHRRTAVRRRFGRRALRHPQQRRHRRRRRRRRSRLRVHDRRHGRHPRPRRVEFRGRDDRRRRLHLQRPRGAGVADASAAAGDRCADARGTEDPARAARDPRAADRQPRRPRAAPLRPQPCRLLPHHADSNRRRRDAARGGRIGRPGGLKSCTSPRVKSTSC